MAFSCPTDGKGISRLLACSAAWLALISVPALGQTYEAVHVEEDWELVLDTPDPLNTAPQITSVFSPLPHTDGLHATFDVNHRSQPDFAQGGMQLQVWVGEEPLLARQHTGDEILSTTAETIRWTQAMTVASSVIVFEITDGDSSTWGEFGGQGYLRAVLSTDLENLNGYDPVVSAQATRIGYASNRVQRLVLKSVRITLSTGEVLEDTTERVVFTK